MDELREAMEAAFPEEEAEQVEQSQTENEPPVPEGEEKPEVDENEKPEPEKTPAPEGEKPSSDDKPASDEGNKPPPKEGQPESSTEGQKSPTKAPYGWSAKARESWGSLPEEAQQQVLKREQEVERVLHESAQARKAVQELNTVLAPHAQRLMAAGIQSPMQAIGTLLQTEGELRAGDSQTKARTIANLIQQYGVDIGTLDAVLTNQAPPSQNGQHAEFEQLLNQKLAPYQQFMDQQTAMARSQQQQSQQAAVQEVEDFARSHEFMPDVRNLTADVLELASKNGEQLTLEQAYDRACQLHPEVSKIIADRKRQEEMMGRDQAAQQKRKAAVSIQGEQGAQNAQSKPANLRDTISQAWADQMNG